MPNTNEASPVVAVYWLRLSVAPAPQGTGDDIIGEGVIAGKRGQELAALV